MKEEDDKKAAEEAAARCVQSSNTPSSGIRANDLVSFVGSGILMIDL